MGAVTTTIHKLVAEATNRDLTLRQLALLGLATCGDGTEVRLASTNLNISKPACTRSADRLIEEGLLQREPVAGDRRRALLTATAKGKRLIEQMARLIT